jgi:SAM-dependent methyltransferase
MSPRLKQRLQRWFWPIMPGWPDEGRRIVQGPHVKTLLDRAAQGSGRFRSVFNAGAGEGGYSPLLLALPGVELVVESDFGWRTSGPARIDPRQVFFGASLTHVPLPDRSMDLILCTEVLEHIPEHELALDEIARVLAPGGWVLITVPTPPAPPDPNHVREGYRAKELSNMLEERGFEVVSHRFCMHFFFRFLLGNWSRFPWRTRMMIRTLGALDKVFLIGPPMDLMMLARSRGDGIAGQSRARTEAAMERAG